MRQGLHVHVIGTAHDKRRRADSQLGLAFTRPSAYYVPDVLASLCRQGDTGSSRYFLSLEDNMFRVFGGERIRALQQAVQACKHGAVARALIHTSCAGKGMRGAAATS